MVEEPPVEDTPANSYSVMAVEEEMEGSDIEHHAIWDMFSKILQEHSGDQVEIELKAIL